MKIALIGYGKIGKAIEEIAIERGHTIAARYTSLLPFNADNLCPFDVAIEFTQPSLALAHIDICLDNHLPIVVGTTGWNEALPSITQKTNDKNGALLHASNFSLGVNLFFVLTQQLAKLMNHRDYTASIEEIHHLQKLDAPSGTAITTAEKLIQNQDTYTTWKSETGKAPLVSPTELAITALREPNVPGTHHVHYDSPEDRITLSHEAKNRRGFALGAVLAAEWILDKKGIYTMSDVLQLK